jgi:hypothetical protein
MHLLVRIEHVQKGVDHLGLQVPRCSSVIGAEHIKVSFPAQQRRALSSGLSPRSKHQNRPHTFLARHLTLILTVMNLQDSREPVPLATHACVE